LNAAAGGPAAFPWDQAMTLGLGLLRLAPEAFWAMTPREFDRAARAVLGDGGDALDRGAVDRMMQAFPDK
jgi:uncharacterized phage protein (TIGR02216 family)